MILSFTKLEHQEYVTILPVTTTVQAIGLLSSCVPSDQQDTGVTLLTSAKKMSVSSHCERSSTLPPVSILPTAQGYDENCVLQPQRLGPPYIW